MIRTNSQPPLLMSTQFKNAGMRGLGGIDYSVTNDIAVAGNTETLGVFKGLQRVVNQVINIMGINTAKVYVDGRIGPKTLSAVRTLLPRVTNANSYDMPATVNELAGRADIIARNMYDRAKQLIPLGDWPAYSTSPAVEPTDYRPSSGSTTPEPGGSGDSNESGSKKLGSAGGMGIYLAGGALALGLIVIASTMDKKKRRPVRGLRRSLRGCRGLSCRG